MKDPKHNLTKDITNVSLRISYEVNFTNTLDCYQPLRLYYEDFCTIGKVFRVLDDDKMRAANATSKLIQSFG